MVYEALDSLLRAIQIGSLYSLIALGLTLTWAIARVPNLAHAELVTAGAYVSVVITRFLIDNILVAAALAFTMSCTLALLMQYVVYGPLNRRGANIFIMMVASFAVSLSMRYVLFVLADIYNMTNITPAIQLEAVGFFLGSPITNLFLWSVPVSFATVLLLHLFLVRTTIGKGLRAVAVNNDLALITGVNIRKAVNVSWIISGGLAGVAGCLLSIIGSANPEVGLEALPQMLAASTIGGFVSLYGTFAGGYIVGFAENPLMDFLNRAFGVSLAFKPLVSVVVIIVVLLLRPNALADITLPDMREKLSKLPNLLKKVFR